jgi:hypothetical protein
VSSLVSQRWSGRRTVRPELGQPCLVPSWPSTDDRACRRLRLSLLLDLAGSAASLVIRPAATSSRSCVLPSLPPSPPALSHTLPPSVTAVSAAELQRLKKRFMKLDRDGSGTIDKDEFLLIPQIANNPLASRMIAIFDEEYVFRIASGPAELSSGRPSARLSLTRHDVDRPSRRAAEEERSTSRSLSAACRPSAAKEDGKRSCAVRPPLSACAPDFGGSTPAVAPPQLTSWRAPPSPLPPAFPSCVQGVRHGPRRLHLERRALPRAQDDGRLESQGAALRVFLR